MPEEKSKTRKKTDPTIKAMSDLDKMLNELTEPQLKLVLNWAFSKHNKDGKKYFTT